MPAGSDLMDRLAAKDQFHRKDGVSARGILKRGEEHPARRDQAEEKVEDVDAFIHVPIPKKLMVLLCLIPAILVYTTTKYRYY